MTSLAVNYNWTPELIAQDKALKEKYGPSAHIIPAKTYEIPTHLTNKLEKTPQNDTVEFSAKKDDSKPVKENKKGGNWGKAIASTFLTGLGQLFDGRTKDGLVDMATDVGLYATAGGLSMAFMNAFAKATQTGAKLGLGGKAAYIGAALAGFGLLANKIHTIVDAYKGGK